jgi:hypothetical protein
VTWGSNIDWRRAAPTLGVLGIIFVLLGVLLFASVDSEEGPAHFTGSTPPTRAFTAPNYTVPPAYVPSHTVPAYTVPSYTSPYTVATTPYTYPQYTTPTTRYSPFSTVDPSGTKLTAADGSFTIDFRESHTLLLSSTVWLGSTLTPASLVTSVTGAPHQNLVLYWTGALTAVQRAASTYEKECAFFSHGAALEQHTMTVGDQLGYLCRVRLGSVGSPYVLDLAFLYNRNRFYEFRYSELTGDTRATFDAFVKSFELHKH